MTKLHLGCGRRQLKGWVHIDLADFEHIDFKTSIDDLSMFSDESVEYVYCSHALEYFDRDEATEALSEWRRVLTQTGWLYVAVPDFNALIKIFSQTSKLDTILGPLFGRMIISGTDQVFYHKTVYDEVSLRSILSQCGFVNIDAYDPVEFLQSIDNSYDDHALAFYPHMDREGIQVSLCLRAQRS